MKKLVAETEKKVKEALDEINKTEPCIVVSELVTNAVEKAAEETMQWWSDACGDMGYNFDQNYFMDDDSAANKAYRSFLKTCANKEYANEAMADWFHSDVDSIVDCTGDHIFDHASMIRSNPAGFAKHIDHDVIFIMICEQIKATNFGNDIKGAMTRMIVDHRERLEKKKARV